MIVRVAILGISLIMSCFQTRAPTFNMAPLSSMFPGEPRNINGLECMSIRLKGSILIPLSVRQFYYILLKFHY